MSHRWMYILMHVLVRIIVVVCVIYILDNLVPIDYDDVVIVIVYWHDVVW